MPAKVRVTATRGVPGQSPEPALIYRAEAYTDDDRFRDVVWICAHEHETVEDALRCGEEWLATSSERLSESA